MAHQGKILVVEDERSMREFLEILLRRHKHEVRVAESGSVAVEILREESFDLLITDLKMPGIGGLELLERCRADHPGTEVIIVTAFATAETAIAAMKQGAYDYLTKPFKVDEIIVTVDRALEKRALVRENLALRERLEGEFRLEHIVGRSPAMRQLFSLIRRVASTRTSVVIQGESGTGKELVAHAIHSCSERAEEPFIAVNCGAIPESLMESELFGHIKGSFTGANQDKIGLFAAAHKGTLFLDEVSELPLSLQVKLLRALQERRIKPVGAVSEQDVDARIIAASNRDLEQEVAEGRFRSDLFFRLNVIALTVPPLRNRREDIPLLAEHFMKKFALETGRAIKSLSSEALAALSRLDFPGNVRELENLIERSVTLSTGDTVEVDALIQLQHPATAASPGLEEIPPEGINLDQRLGELENALIQQAMVRADGNRTAAARMLGISLRSLRYRLAKA